MFGDGPMLTILEGEEGLVIYYDASAQGLGAMQHEKVITYASQQLKDYERIT